jgi:Zn-finger nucleic acid-binding protein
MDYAICLGCGGAVDEGNGIPEDESPCTCPPPSIEPATVACPTCGGALRVGARACQFCHCTLATRRCGDCAAWNLAEAIHCQACGRALAADHPGGDEQTDRNCPRCSGALTARRYGELDVEECDGCGGLMVAQQVMDRIVQNKDAPTNVRVALPERSSVREAQVSYIRCPQCGDMMNRRAFGQISGVVVDVCRDHGVWFDPGELGQVLAFVEKGGLGEARRRETETLNEARRSVRTEQMRATMGSMGSQNAALEHQGMTGGMRSPGVEFLRALVSLWS